MKKYLFILFVCLYTSAWAQNAPISGKVIDSEGKPVELVNVQVKGKSTGVLTKNDGTFSIAGKSLQFPISLVLSSIGFETMEVVVKDGNSPLTIKLTGRAILLNEVVTSATRINQSSLESPVSIEKMGQRAIKENPSFTFYDGLQSLKGMEAVTSSLTYKQVNARGFNSTGNSRFLQLIDGVDNQTPGLNFSVGNLFGSSDLDIESAELIPGAASALYGPVAFNGLLSVKTKDAFDYQGLSFQVKTGINHLGESGSSAQGIQDYALRFAKAVNNRLAFKVNASYLSGTDWYANNYTDVSANSPAAQRGPNNPNRDALNIYGDEVSQNVPGVGLVSRTGYEEKDLMNYQVYSLKLNGAVQYKFSDKLEAIYQYNFGQGTASYTGSSRFDLNNFVLQTHRLELRGKNFFVRTYSVEENSHDSYNTRSLAQFINRTWVKDLNGNVVSAQQADNMWFTRYGAAFNGTIPGVSGNSTSAARAFADQGRLLPGTAAFDAAKDASIHNYGLAGAGVFSNSKIYHTDAQYDLSSALKVLDVLIGGSYRQYSMFTNGSLFDDKTNRIKINEYGMFIQASKKLLNDKLKLMASLRYDKNENFDGNTTPRFSSVYQVAKNHFFRASYQTGFRNPTPVDQFINLNVGPITILGGAPVNSANVNAYQNSFTAASVGAFGGAFGAALGAGASPQQALAKAKELLVKSNVAYIKPEQQKAFEIGYKGVINSKLLLDVNYYSSSYTDFILNTVVVAPNNNILGSDGKASMAAAMDLVSGPTNYHAYQLYTNAKDQVSAEGGSLGLTYLFPNGYVLSGNATLSMFYLGDANINNVAQFNTPKWSSNLSVGNPNVKNGYGFNVNWHWQSAFDWYGTFNGLRPGQVEAYSLVDLQVNKKLPKLHTTIKIGGSNILNHYVSQAYGSPAVGGIYYVSLVYDNPLK